MHRMRLLFFGSLLLSAAAALPAAGGVVHWLEVEDIIGPVSAQYMMEAMDRATAENAELLVIQLDTPGGLMTSMRQIIKHMLASGTPVCLYVGPEGAHAASAGTFMMMAAHVAAMTPGTNLGAASPVAMGGADLDSTMASKVMEDSEAYIRSLARLRNRNQEWAVSAVHDAEAIPAEEALELGVIDFLAKTPTDLLEQIHGFQVSLSGDSTRVLNTAGAIIENQTLSLRYRALSLLNNPTVAYPGAIFPGVVGAISLILGLMGLQTLSLNYAGLLLIVLSLVLFFLEIKIVSGGLLTVGGIAALAAGSLMLFDSPAPFLRVSKGVLIPFTLLTSGFFVFTVLMAARAQKRKVITGREQLVGHEGTVVRALNPRGSIFVLGEHWSAEAISGETLEAGAAVRVVDERHLHLLVERISATE
jgi:membrane-bound serine protease (ClpP class)